MRLTRVKFRMNRAGSRAIPSKDGLEKKPFHGIKTSGMVEETNLYLRLIVKSYFFRGVVDITKVLVTYWS